VTLVKVQNITKIYDMGEVQVQALRGVSLAVEEGEFLIVMGPSGSGKSTFMNILGCLDRPTDGRYFLGGREVSTLTPDELAEMRNLKLGFVFQGFNLLARTSAIENVELPLFYRHPIPARQREAKALAALARVGLAERANHMPNQLSGGEQQRVAIARALVTQPSLILADEPTGNLDTKTSNEIMELFCDLNRKNNITIVMVTHEPDVAAYGSRQVAFRDGEVISDHPTPGREQGGQRA